MKVSFERVFTFFFYTVATIALLQAFAQDQMSKEDTQTFRRLMLALFVVCAVVFFYSWLKCKSKHKLLMSFVALMLVVLLYFRIYRFYFLILAILLFNTVVFDMLHFNLPTSTFRIFENALRIVN